MRMSEFLGLIKNYIQGLTDSKGYINLINKLQEMQRETISYCEAVLKFPEEK